MQTHTTTNLYILKPNYKDMVKDKEETSSKEKEEPVVKKKCNCTVESIGTCHY